ncbi:MAG: DUF222 domain-containing protein [Candidatus Nanopelagicales bacterium]
METFFEVSRGARRRARIRAELPTDPPLALVEVSTAIDALPDPEFLCAEERAAAITAAARQRNRLDAYLCDLAGSADRHGDAQVLHAGTTGTLVAAATGSATAVGSAIVMTAAALRDLPVVAEAFREGDLSGAHVHAITSHAETISEFKDLEPAVVQLATQTDPTEVGRILRVVADAETDGDRGDLDYAVQRGKRSLRITARANGMWRLEGLLDEISGAAVANALAAFTAPRDSHDTTTANQRRADALTDIADATIANSKPLGTNAVSILVDIDQLPDGQGAHLTDDIALTPATFDLLSCTAVCSVILGVIRADTFVPLALGRSARIANAAQWAALIARDRGCIRCGRAPRYCQAHHIIHWKNGGLTNLSNLALLCSRCHHDLHDSRYTITMDTHGVPHITPNRGPPSVRRA